MAFCLTSLSKLTVNPSNSIRYHPALINKIEVMMKTRSTMLLVVGGLINGAAGVGIGAGAGVGAALFSKGKEAEVKSGTEFNMILNRSLLLPEYKSGG